MKTTEEEMKVTIDEIRGEMHTIIWHKPSLSIHLDVKHLSWIPAHVGYVCSTDEKCYVTALPPLPRFKNSKNAYLFDLYRGYELYALEDGSGYLPFARTKDGKRVDIAVTDKEV